MQIWSWLASQEQDNLDQSQCSLRLVSRFQDNIIRRFKDRLIILNSDSLCLINSINQSQVSLSTGKPSPDSLTNHKWANRSLDKWTQWWGSRRWASQCLGSSTRPDNPRWASQCRVSSSNHTASRDFKTKLWGKSSKCQLNSLDRCKDSILEIWPASNSPRDNLVINRASQWDKDSNSSHLTKDSTSNSILTNLAISNFPNSRSLSNSD